MNNTQKASLCNQQNISNVFNIIQQKQCYQPYFTSTTNVLTDYDLFPYTRWFRGIATSKDPIVAEREAGWRPRRDDCYKDNYYGKPTYPVKLCFESACSTVFPCKAKTEIEDSNYLDNSIEDSHVVSYR